MSQCNHNDTMILATTYDWCTYCGAIRLRDAEAVRHWIHPRGCDEVVNQIRKTPVEQRSDTNAE